MIKRVVVDLFLICSIIFLLHTKYVNITFRNAAPDLLLIFIVLIGLFEGEGIHSILLGFFGGLAIDFMGGSSPLGFYALIYLVVGYLTVIPHKFFNVESLFVALLSLLVFFVIRIILYSITGCIFFSTEEVRGYFSQTLLIEFLYTAAVSIVMFFLFKKIYLFIDKMRKHD